MNVILLLEKLSKLPFYDPKINTLISSLPTNIQSTFRKSDSTLLKQTISCNDYYANEQDIVQLPHHNRAL